MSYRSRYVKSGQNLSLQKEKNVLDKRRPIKHQLKGTLLKQSNKHQNSQKTLIKVDQKKEIIN